MTLSPPWRLIHAVDVERLPVDRAGDFNVRSLSHSLVFAEGHHASDTAQDQRSAIHKRGVIRLGSTVS
jgi:hypothetical protein